MPAQLEPGRRPGAVHQGADAARQLDVSKDDLARINKAFVDHGIYDGWERAGYRRDGTTLAENVPAAAEATDQSPNVAVSGSHWAMSTVDLKSFFDGTPEYSLRWGTFKNPEKSLRTVSDPNAWDLDPAVDGKRLVYARTGVNGSDIVEVTGKGAKTRKKVLVGGAGDQREPSIRGRNLAWVDVQGDEADAYLKVGDRAPVNLTPQPGSHVVRPTIAGGKVAFLDHRADRIYLTSYDIATGKTTSTKLPSLLSDFGNLAHNGPGRSRWRPTSCCSASSRSRRTTSTTRVPSPCTSS